MATAVTANRAELIAIANSVASEKMIDKAIVIEAMEDAIQRAARSRYGAENDIRAKLDPNTGDLRLWRVVEVVEAVDDYFKQVDVKGAQKLQKDAALGDFIVDPLPPIEFGRIAAQAAKQVIFQKVRDAERERQFEEYKDRAGEIITGVVKRVEFGHVVVDLGRAEGVIRRDAQIPREVVRVNDRIRSLILNVRRENRGPQIFLSRAHPDFMNHDSSIDPVGACVGMKGSRVQAVVQEMQGEKIDIIPWSPDIATFVVNALQPASVSRVVIDEEEERIEVVVPDDQLSLAIGRRGQNVRLASQLTGKAIDILTEADASEKRQKDFVERSAMFEKELDVDETLAQLLVAEGFTSLEEVAYVEVEEIAGIEGFDEDLAGELQNRATEALERRDAASREERTALGVEDALIDMPYLNEAMLVTLGKAGIKTLDDLADLATDELVEKKRAEPRRRNDDAPKRPEPKGGILAEYGLSDEQGNEIIMAARAHWFEDEAPEADAVEADEAPVEEASPEDTAAEDVGADDTAAEDTAADDVVADDAADTTDAKSEDDKA
jgi:N utilization substance protein A